MTVQRSVSVTCTVTGEDEETLALNVAFTVDRLREEAGDLPDVVHVHPMAEVGDIEQGDE